MDGLGADTFAYVGISDNLVLGLQPTVDTFVMEVPIQTRAEDTGKTICIDSSWYPPGGTWIWAPIDISNPCVIPEWSGAQCFTISSCCIGNTGNIDYDPAGLVDIGDLTALISFLYVPPNAGPVCLVQANVDGDPDGNVDMGDLTALINYLYIPPNPLPAACQ